MSLQIEYVPFSEKYECLPKIVGVLDTGNRRILAGSKECLKKLIMEHFATSDAAKAHDFLGDIETSCPLPQTIEELSRDHKVLISILNESPPSMWAGVIGMWIDPERRMKSQR